MSRFFLALAALTLIGCNQDASSPDGGDCDARATVTVGTPINGALAAGDCTIDGRRVDNYTFQLTAQSVLSLTAGSVQFDLENAGASAAEQEVFSDMTGNQTAALPPGTYTIRVHGSGNAGYTLSVARTSLPTGCNQQIYIVRGTSVSGSISQATCANNSYYGQPFSFLGVGNQSYTFSTTADMGVNLEVNRAGTYLANRANNNAGSNSLTFRAPSTDRYNIGVIAIPQNRFGTYTLTVQ